MDDRILVGVDPAAPGKDASFVYVTRDGVQIWPRPAPSQILRRAVHEILARAQFRRRVIDRMKRQLGAGTASNTLPAS